MSAPEEMEIDAIETSSFSNPRWLPAVHGRGRGQGQLTCFRCHKPGHRGAECRAPAPVLTSVKAADKSAVESSGMSKHGLDQ